MSNSEEWLARVERVLRSDSSDFNDLAEIAGIDPGIMFLGTKMDGADIRGQDLSRFRFTHLDVGAVFIDSKTILPASLGNDVGDPGAASKTETSVALLFDGRPVSYSFYSEYFQNFRTYSVFNDTEVEKFIDFTAQGGYLPIIITEPRTIYDRGFINDDRLRDSINVIRVSSVQELKVSLDFAGITSRPTVLIPQGKGITGHYGSRRSVAEAVRFVATNLAHIKGILSEVGVVSIFLADEKLNNTYEAWAQLFDRSYAIIGGSNFVPTVFINQSYYAGDGSDLGEMLFEGANKINIRGDGSAKSGIVLAVPTSAKSMPIRRVPEVILSEILAGRGWQVGLFSKSNEFDGVDLTISAVRKFNLVVKSYSNQRSKDSAYTPLPRRYFGDTNENVIIVEEGVSDISFIHSLMVKGELRLPANIVGAFKPDASSVWPLVAVRILGFISSRKIELRSAFALWVISVAGQRGHDSRNLAETFGSLYKELGPSAVFRFGDIETDEVGTRFRMQLSDKDAVFEDHWGYGAQGDVSITDDGLRILAANPSQGPIAVGR